MVTGHNGLFRLISVPPCRGYMFLIVIPQRNSKHKTLYPWGIPSLKHFIPEEFQAVTNSKLKTFYPWRIPSSKHISPKEFHAQTLYPWGIAKSKSFTPEEFQLVTNFKPKTLYPEKFSTQNTLPLKNSKPWIWSIQSSNHFTLSLKNLKPFIPEECHYNDRHTPEEFHINFIVPWRIPHQLY